MIRIAYVIDYLLGPNGGTEGQLLSLINGLDRSKFKPYLVYLHETEWTRKHEFPIETIRFDVNKIMSGNYLKQIIRFRNLSQ